MIHRKHDSRNTHITIMLQKVANGYEIIECLTDQTVRKPVHKTTVQPPPPPPPKINSDREQQVSKKEWLLQNWDAIVPAPARWFCLEVIHQIEKDALPEFFHSTYHNDQSYLKGNYKTPLTYLKIRNSMIEKWIETQNKYLKFTDCLNFIAGDASSLLRVFTFLEHWGLINFQYNPNNLPNQGHVFQMNGGFLERIKLNFQSNSINFHIESNQECQICEMKIIPFHQQKKETLAKFQLQQLLICNDCFVQKKYPRFLQNEDFSIIQSTQKFAPWTMEEIYRLIELVYKFKERWNEIAKYFTKRSLTEIVKMYIQLPYSNLFPTLDKEQQIQKRPLKTAISFHNDLSNPIQLGIACFKSQLDKIKLAKEEEEQQINQENVNYTIEPLFTQMIDVQLTKIEEQMQFIDNYEQLITQENQYIQSIQKKNLQMQVQLNNVE